MRLITTNLQPLLLILLSSILASNPAAADDQHIHIEASATTAMVQFCGAKEACKSIRFSAISPAMLPSDEETNPTQESENNSSLIDNINVLLFGF